MCEPNQICRVVCPLSVTSQIYHYDITYQYIVVVFIQYFDDVF